MKVALIVPTQNVLKEETEILALPPANKQAKSLTGIAIPKREGKQGTKRGKGRKESVKREQIKEGEETEIKIKEEVEEDSDFLEVDKVVSSKQKHLYNSKYLQD
jgi:hypothetical protein